MRYNLLIEGMLASIALVPALAQSNPPASSQPPAATATPVPAVTKTQGNLWRASKLKGLNVYNEQNEKLGDITEILIDKSGKVDGIVIGVGGFLGMGQHDIKVEMSKLKFVDEPVRTSSTSNTGTTGANTRATTTTSSTATSANDHKWYPDHAILSGASKEQLKSMPQFKFD
ncbi:MAG: PRC-barrel domain-containing protein [Bradyrhizobium sp.]|nr:PRC-barrel domain-containing protein [Bradyrhizobium sp.]